MAYEYPNPAKEIPEHLGPFYDGIIAGLEERRKAGVFDDLDALVAELVSDPGGLQAFFDAQGCAESDYPQ
ncbi:MAG TPA: hypothetical protein VMY99_04255 [Nevskiaceae bacterium]|nr:hypothetical protein [Nevskiaceae bacterium]